MAVPDLGGAMQGLNSWRENNIGYRGPAPPRGDGVHHYVFKLYALDTILPRHHGMTKDELLLRCVGHILGRSIQVGTYERE